MDKTFPTPCPNAQLHIEKPMTILVTGAAGFIGAHVLALLRSQGVAAMGLDNFNDYYSPQLKRDRVAALLPGETVLNVDCADAQRLTAVFKAHAIDTVIHLAAQAGVRYSLENPQAYVQANLVGFGNMLEVCRQHRIKHLVYASSSSVYGANKTLPWQEDQSVDHPLSLYAATKKANELMAHTYSHLYALPTTGLRFFTVYGPWGRPDMAPMLFANAMTKGKPIKLFNHGVMSRDFTYIDDIVAAVCAVAAKPATGVAEEASRPSVSHAPYRVFNIGNRHTVSLLDFVKTMERALGVKATTQLEAMQPGDVPATWADTNYLRDWIGFEPSTPLSVGLELFAQWHRSYFASVS
jgi:UDP-glucuronate 4-epimerase